MQNKILLSTVALITAGVVSSTPLFLQQGSTQASAAPHVIDAPAKDEAIFIFDSGVAVRAKIGSLVSIPQGEKLRGVWGPEVRVKLDAKGTDSGNSIWLVDER